MTKLKHTRGPWEVNEASANRVTGPTGVTIAAVYGGSVGHQEQLSNCRLIAAAPAMLEYIAMKAEEGDAEAQSIVAGIEGPKP